MKRQKKRLGGHKHDKKKKHVEKYRREKVEIIVMAQVGRGHVQTDWLRDWWRTGVDKGGTDKERKGDKVSVFF